MAISSSKRTSKIVLAKIFALTLVVASSLSAASHTRELCHGFLPENDMQIPVGFKSMATGAAGLSEIEFNAVLDRAQRLYAPVIQQRGGTLKINRLWSDKTVNASAQQMGGSWVLNMYGGLARHPATTVEGFALVVCHELGHHIGGAPKIAGMKLPFPFPFPIPGGSQWATNEGGADYFANLKCMRNFFAEEDNAAVLETAKSEGRLSAFAAELCDREFSADADRLLCKRATLGGTSVAGLFQELRKETTAPDFAKPDTTQVSKMFDDHPATQCRMDTYLAGAICNVDQTVALSDTDYRQGSCVENVAKLGFRPRCWFAP